MSQSNSYWHDDATNEAAEPPSVTVVDAVAAAAGKEPHELEPLYDAIDPDALDHIFADGGSVVHRAGNVEFTYCGFQVVVSVDEYGTNVMVS